MRGWVIGGLFVVAGLAGGALLLGPRLAGPALRASVEMALDMAPAAVGLRHGALTYHPTTDRLALESLAFSLTDAAGRPLQVVAEGIEIDGALPANLYRVVDARAYAADSRSIAPQALAARLAIRRLMVTTAENIYLITDLDVLNPGARQFASPPPQSMAELQALDAGRLEDIVRGLTWQSVGAAVVSVTLPAGPEWMHATHVDLGAFEGQRLATAGVASLKLRAEQNSLDITNLSIGRLDVAALIRPLGEDGPGSGAGLLKALSFERAGLASASFVDATDSSSGSLGKVEMAGVNGAQAASISLSDVGVVTGNGTFRLAGVRLASLDATRLQAALVAGTADVTSGAVRLGEYEMTGLSVELPSGGPVTVARVLMNGLSYADDVPTGCQLLIEGLKVPVASLGDEEARRPFLDLGFGDLVFDLQLDYAYDPVLRLVDLRKVSLGLVEGGTLSLAATIEGIAPDIFGGNPMAAMAGATDARLRVATLTYEDLSLVGRGLAFAGKGWGLTPEQALGEIRNTLQTSLKTARSNVTRNAVRSLIAFLNEPGRLVVQLQPAQPVGLEQIQAVAGETDMLASLLNLTVVAEKR